MGDGPAAALLLRSRYFGDDEMAGAILLRLHYFGDDDIMNLATILHKNSIIRRLGQLLIFVSSKRSGPYYNFFPTTNASIFMNDLLFFMPS